MGTVLWRVYGVGVRWVYAWLACVYALGMRVVSLGVRVYVDTLTW